MANTETHRQLHIMVPAVMHHGLGRLAAKANASVSAYAATLLGAAYAARVKPPTGDRDLDAVVARCGILFAEGRDPAAIAAALDLKPATVAKIIKAWQSELAEGRP